MFSILRMYRLHQQKKTEIFGQFQFPELRGIAICMLAGCKNRSFFSFLFFALLCFALLSAVLPAAASMPVVLFSSASQRCTCAASMIGMIRTIVLHRFFLVSSRLKNRKRHLHRCPSHIARTGSQSAYSRSVKGFFVLSIICLKLIILI